MAKTPTNTDSSVIDLDDSDVASPAGVAVTNAAPVASRQVASSGHDVELSGRKVSITINDGRDDSERAPVFLSINGYAYQINRNERVTVPYELLEILQNAKEERMEGTHGGGVKMVTVHRFSYSMDGEVK